MTIMQRALKLIPFWLLLTAGCGGSQQTLPSESGWSDDLSDPSMQFATQTAEQQPQGSNDAPTPISAPPKTPPTEMRVRHDLMMAKDTPREATCSCLSVIVAPSATDPRLQWIDAPPKLESDVALVAVSNKEIACPGLPADSTDRPSIAGVERDGPDVVITIENLPPGRPLASGAVIPKPQQGGAVYVKPKGAKVPFGKPMAGSGRCRVKM